MSESVNSEWCVVKWCVVRQMVCGESGNGVWSRRREEEGGEEEEEEEAGGGGGGRTAPKVRTPHKDVGNKNNNMGYR